MNSPKVKAACKEAFEGLMKLSPEELKAQIDAHVPGDIYHFMMETGAAELIAEEFNKRKNDLQNE